MIHYDNMYVIPLFFSNDAFMLQFLSFSWHFCLELTVLADDTLSIWVIEWESLTPLSFIEVWMTLLSSQEERGILCVLYLSSWRQSSTLNLTWCLYWCKDSWDTRSGFGCVMQVEMELLLRQQETKIAFEILMTEMNRKKEMLPNQPRDTWDESERHLLRDQNLVSSFS